MQGWAAPDLRGSGETLQAVYDAVRNTGGTDALFREQPAIKDGESPE